MRKPVFGVSDLVPHKPGCTATEDGWRLEILYLGRREIVLSVQKTKALISFAVTVKLICVFVFAYAKSWFSHDAAHLESYELHHEKTSFFAYAKNKSADQLRCAVTAQLSSACVFAIHKIQSIYFIYLKFQVSSSLLWLYSLVCVRPGRKHLRQVIS